MLPERAKHLCKERQSCQQLPDFFTFQQIHFVSLLSLHHAAISSVLSCFYLVFILLCLCLCCLCLWFNFLWWICLLLFLKDLSFLSYQPSLFHSHPILLSQTTLSNSAILTRSPFTRLSTIHHLLLVLFPLCFPSFISSIISSMPFYPIPVFWIPFFFFF